MVSTTAGPETRAGQLITCQSIKEFTAFPIGRVVTGAGPIQRAIYDWTILGLGLSVKSEAVNGRRGGVPLFGRKSFQRCTLRCFNAWCHTGLQFALTVVCVCPQPGSGRWASVQTWAERTSEAKCFREAWWPCEASLKTKGALWTHLSRKSLSTTAEMSSRGFPIPKSAFSLCRDRSRLFHSDSHASSPHNYQSLVSDLMDPVSVALICLLLFWKLSMNNNICATHGTRKCDHLQSDFVSFWENNSVQLCIKVEQMNSLSISFYSSYSKPIHRMRWLK